MKNFKTEILLTYEHNSRYKWRYYLRMDSRCFYLKLLLTYKEYKYVNDRKTIHFGLFMLVAFS